MPEIVLTTLNARYAHASFGLRYLHANLAELRERSEIVEFEISQRPVDLLEVLMARNPKIVGLGVYIWNIDQATRLVADLKRVRPEVIVVLGGPEVSYESREMEITRLADYVICGEGDLAFRDLCRNLLSGRRNSFEQAESTAGDGKFIAAQLPQFKDLQSPYSLYTDADLANRVLYVEASRGCPYECEFCLSALEIPVRQAALEAFLVEMDRLLERGARQFKFVDRTFNLNLKTSRAILEFFLARLRPGLFVHFEMIPDRLPEGLREVIRQFPAGALQFEVGIQTFNPEVAVLISRRQNLEETEANLRWLRDETGVHVHADLIVGLPGESLESFGKGFDRLVALRPQEIQVGMLKRLRGTPITRHDAEWGMVYSAHAPYEILQTRLIDFPAMQRLRRFARYWDLVANSGNFVESTPLIWRQRSPFESFLAFSDWLYLASGKTNGIALKRLAEYLFDYLTNVSPGESLQVARSVWNDYQRGGKSDRPPFLRPYIEQLEQREKFEPARDSPRALEVPKRQARHSQ